MKITEQVLWYLLDTVAVRESAMGGDRKKVDAVLALMSQLPKPAPHECRRLYAAEYMVVKS